jgi:hypothetical protein
MALYETVIPGEVRSYPRANKVELLHTEPPEARVHVVDKTTYPNGEVKDQNPVQLDHIMTDPNLEIPFVDPETYEPTELTFKAGEFALMATSLAMWKIRQHKGIE